jgi:hypothetical protein
MKYGLYRSEVRIDAIIEREGATSLQLPDNSKASFAISGLASALKLPRLVENSGPGARKKATFGASH